MTMSIWLDVAWDDMAAPIRTWIHRPSEGKEAIFDAWRELEPKARQAWEADVRSAVQRAHGASTFVGYRRIKGSEHLGGMSVTTEKSNAKAAPGHEVAAYRISADDVLVHWGQGGPLSGGFAHEKEVILKPNAKPQRIAMESLSSQLSEAIDD
jgi:hypothetical protein